MPKADSASHGADKCAARIEKARLRRRKRRNLSSAKEDRITLAVAGPVETVVVSATRTETTPEQAAVSANVITQQQLSALNYPMLSDVLRDIPGLQVSQYGAPGALARNLHARRRADRHAGPAGWRAAQ